MDIVIKTGPKGPELLHLSDSPTEADAAFKAVELVSGERLSWFHKPEPYKQRRGSVPTVVEPSATVDNFPVSAESLPSSEAKAAAAADAEAAAAAAKKKGKH